MKKGCSIVEKSTRSCSNGSIPSAGYYRPLQYLGSKTRSINTIVSECSRLYHKGSFTFDMFSGSSIVSQALNSKGQRIISNDILSFCSDIATCMLNVKRGGITKADVEKYMSFVLNYKISDNYFTPFRAYIDQENRYIKSQDLAGLKQTYEGIPQVWKLDCQNNCNQSNYIENHYGKPAFGAVPLIANYYAGTYFGIKQSLELDSLRNGIEKVFEENGHIWLKALFLTALYNVMSLIVHSAGKHFAQPISMSDTNPIKVTNKRLFENRSLDVGLLFKECVNSILSSTSVNTVCNKENIVLNEDITSTSIVQSIKDIPVSVVYADPPYTAQQYSRFYHIPEIVHSYCYPQLQIFKGQVTNGIYPTNKYKSPFCTKTQAYLAFTKIFEIVRIKGASLVLSYSESKNSNTGNERMISLSDIMNIAKDYLPNYSINKIDFDFNYRQLNSKKKVVPEKEDKEILIVFESV